jgi:hypothetical protein
MTDDELSALRLRLVALRDDLLARLSKEMGAGELGLMPGVMTAILAIDKKRDERAKSGDPGRQKNGHQPSDLR